jgi:predicted RNA binding protein with dsRBD fold (UPF0201 family)
MTSQYLIEAGVDGYLLEDGSGVLLIDEIVQVNNETVGITESVQPHWTKIITNNVRLTETNNIAKGFVKLVSDTVRLVFSKVTKTRNQNYLLEDNSNDALLLEDGSGLYLLDVLLANINENVRVTESSNKVLGLLKNIADEIRFTDAVNYATGFFKVVTSSLVALESTINKLLTEVNTYLLEDSSGRYQTEEDTDLYQLDQLLIVKTAALSTVGLTEASQKYLGPIKTILDTVRLEEASNRLGSLVRNATTFTVRITEANNRSRIMFRNVATSTMRITEASNRLGGLIRNIASTLRLTEASNKLRGRLQNISDTVGLTEVLNTITGIVKVIDETVGFTEALNRIRVVFISNNLGDFIVVDATDLETFTALDSMDFSDMIVIDSYNFDSFIIIDDN